MICARGEEDRAYAPMRRFEPGEVQHDRGAAEVERGFRRNR